MCSYGVSEASKGTGERVGRMMNGTSFALGSVARLRASGGGRTMGAETSVNNGFAEVGVFRK